MNVSEISAESRTNRRKALLERKKHDFIKNNYSNSVAYEVDLDDDDGDDVEDDNVNADGIDSTKNDKEEYESEDENNDEQEGGKESGMFYDDTLDSRDEKWVAENILQNNNNKAVGGVVVAITCPGCFCVLSYHAMPKKRLLEFSAFSVVNCNIKRNAILKRGDGEFFQVVCESCDNPVGFYCVKENSANRRNEKASVGEYLFVEVISSEFR